MKRSKMSGRRLWCAGFAVLLLSGCAANALHGDGMALLEEGKYEEAVAKLGEASRQAPDDIEYRRDFVRAREQVVNGLITIGDTERGAQRFDGAEAAYQRALQIAPNDSRTVLRLQMVARDRRHAALVAQAEALLQKGATQRAAELLKKVFLENPNHGKALELQREISDREAERLAAAPELSANFKKPVTLQFRDANLKMVFESISLTSGINILLDKDVRADLRTSIFVKNTSVEDAINLVLMQNQLEKKVLSENTLFIYPQLPAKDRSYQDLKVRSFHLVHADAKQMLTVIKTMLKTKDILAHEKTNSLIMRDTPDVIRLAEKIVADQDIAVPEVMLEVEVLEVTHTLLSDLGIRYPGMVTLTPSVPGGGPLTVKNFSSAVERENLIVSPVPTITFNASLTKTNSKILASPRLRTRTREKAKIHIGDRLPVFTNSITPLSTGAAVTTGTVQYVDTGIKLEVEPDIHPNGEVAIKISLEVSVAQAAVTNPQSGTTAYPISTRTTSTVLQLRDGETNVLAGLIKDNESNSKVMIPGLGEIPALGRLFGSDHRDGGRTEIILSITPRLLGSTHLPDARLVEFWSGTEANPRSEPMQLHSAGSVSMSTSTGAQSPDLRGARAPRTPRAGLPLRPGGPIRPSVLPVPGTRPAPGAPEVSAVAQPMTFNWTGPAQAKVGDRFTLTLSAQSQEAVGNLGLTLSYDPSQLKAVDAVEGTFGKQEGAGADFTREIDQDGGQITVEVANADAQGSKGAGSVTAITFEVTAAGASQISVAKVMPAGPSGEAVNFAPPAAHSMTLEP
jgi:general secretion pathway protein D